MKKLLSVIMIINNKPEKLEECLKSVSSLADEIIVVDNGMDKESYFMCKDFGCYIFKSQSKNLGELKKKALSKSRGKWILSLDSDEIVSPRLKEEILCQIRKKNHRLDGFIIPYQNHLFGKRIYWGGENYRMLRLFKKNKVTISSSYIHEKFKIATNRLAYLKGKIYHYSYRNLFQMLKKFTNYGLREGYQRFLKKEKLTLKKLILNPIHMFWARFVESKGYRDGIFRIILDLGFAYMEFLSYFYLFFLKIFKRKRYF